MFDWIVPLIESIGFETCVRVGATCICAGIAAVGVCVLFDANHLGPIVFGADKYKRYSFVTEAYQHEYLGFIKKCYDIYVTNPAFSKLHFILPDKYCITRSAFLSDLAAFTANVKIAGRAAKGRSFQGGLSEAVKTEIEWRLATEVSLDFKAVVTREANFSWLGWFAVAAAIAVGVVLITAAIKKKEPEVSSVKNTVSLKAVREAEPRLFSYSSRRISNIELGDVQPAVRLDTEETLQLAISDFLLLLNPSTVEHVTVLTALV